jgi:hypothetical protein
MIGYTSITGKLSGILQKVEVTSENGARHVAIYFISDGGTVIVENAEIVFNSNNIRISGWVVTAGNTFATPPFIRRTYYVKMRSK